MLLMLVLQASLAQFNGWTFFGFQFCISHDTARGVFAGFTSMVVISKSHITIYILVQQMQQVTVSNPTANLDVA